MKCLICGSQFVIEALKTTEPNGWDVNSERPVAYLQCGRCRVVWKDPMPDQGALKKYYQESWQFTEPRPSRCFMSAAEWLAELIPRSLPAAIDVGAKNMDFLDEVERHCGSIDEKSLIDANPRHGGVEKAWVGDGYKTEKKYDLVVATHILEHSVDPRFFMRDLVEMMREGGHLYVEVPSLEIGYRDRSACDDINPNHLWHFSVQSLCHLASIFGLRVAKCQSDALADGWPCNRLLAVLDDPDPFESLTKGLLRDYETAHRNILDGWRDGDGLYGASFSCWRMLHDFAGLHGKPLFDLYKSGSCLGTRIYHPDVFPSLGIKRVWLTPRAWNSKEEIGQWLARHHPTIEVLWPYEGMVEA